MPLDPVTGPMPREKLKELAAAPAGEAVKIIRQYDPQWGRAPGEKFAWEVRVRRDGADTGVAYVEAASQEEADKLADDLDESEIDWDYSGDDFFITSVEPQKIRKVA